MPEWKQQLHGAFEANGHTCDADVLEELSTHAAAAYETLRAEGHTLSEAERRVEALISTLAIGPTDHGKQIKSNIREMNW